MWPSGRRYLSRRSLVFFSYLVVALSAAPAQDALPNFDSRDQARLDQRIASSKPGAEAAKLAARPAQARRYLSAASDEGLREARLRLNRWGLPATLWNLDAPLAPASDASAETIARSFLAANAELFQLSETEVDALKLRAVVSIGEASAHHFVQRVAGVDVFGGTVTVVVGAGGEVLRAGVGQIVPAAALSPEAFTLSAEQAAREALTAAGYRKDANLTRIAAAAAEVEAFDGPSGRIELRRVAFPSGPASLSAAYETYIHKAEETYQLIVSAESGGLLLRQSLVSHMSSGRVYRQSPLQGPPEVVDFPAAWMLGAGTTTNGAFIDAYRDANGDGVPDSGAITNLSNGRAFAPTSVFDFPFPAPGQNPRGFAAAAVTNAFALTNRAHDYFYALGFDEAAGNLQVNNGGKGGIGGDPAIVRVHDPNLFEGARATTLPDGMSGIIMLAFAFGDDTSNRNLDRDDAYSGTTVIHEYTHLVSERLINGPGRNRCLIGKQTRPLGEGWSDYFAASFFSDPVYGAYKSGDPVKGSRRASLADNPFTYADLGNDGFEEHRDGEIWAAMLWDVRQALGQQSADQLILDGMKLTGCDASMIEARDAILEADRIRNQRANATALWRVFAEHGMGVSATGWDGFRLDPVMFTAAFDTPPSAQGNRLPLINSRNEELVFFGEQLSYQIDAVDPDGDTLTYELLDGPAGAAVSPAGRLTWTANQFSEQRIRVGVSDRSGRVIHGVSVTIVTELQQRRSITVNGPPFAQGWAFFPVAPNTPIVQLTTRGGTGDIDLGVFAPIAGETYSSRRVNNDETLTFANPAPGNWLVLLLPITEYSGVQMQVSEPTARDSTPNSTISEISRPASSESFYRVNVPSGAGALTVSTGGGSGDVDLFLAFNRYPICQVSELVDTPCNFDAGAFTAGNYHSITIENGVTPKRARVQSPAAGTWFINLSAHEAIAGVTLNIALDTGRGVPILSLGGAVNAASFTPILSPGQISSLFGIALVPQTEIAATLPLPRQMQGVQVLVNGVPAPLFFGSAGQINFQTPSDTALGEAAITVRANGLNGNLIPAAVQADAPGIFMYTSAAGVLEPVVTHADLSLVTPQSPARPREIVVIYFTGLSSLSNRPASGEAAGANPPSIATINPVVTVGGQPATVLYAGLTSGLVGLGQLNIELPAQLPSANRATLQVSVGPFAATPVELAVAP